MPIGPIEVQPIFDTLTDSGPLAATVRQVAQDLPAAASRNLIEVFNRLCTSAADIPVAYLEGIAAERRATTASKISMEKAVASNIVGKVDVPDEYVQSATKKIAEKLIGKQRNIDRTVAKAVHLLKDTPSPGSPNSQGEINSDWLNHFAAEAEKTTAEHMQTLFAKVLAREIRKPGSFSIKSLRTLSEMDRHTAEKFVILCSLTAIVEVADNSHLGVVLWSGINTIHEPRRREIKDMLPDLEAEGLIYSNERHVYFDRHICTENFEETAGVPLRLDGRKFRLRDRTRAFQNASKESFFQNCVVLTRTGKDLFDIANEPIDGEYLDRFRITMDEAGLTVEEI